MQLNAKQRQKGAAMQRSTQTDYQTLKALSERSGLHLLVVFRLMRGEHVKDPDARQRLFRAQSELQQETGSHVTRNVGLRRSQPVRIER
jgi:hypothetical protein